MVPSPEDVKSYFPQTRVRNTLRQILPLTCFFKVASTERLYRLYFSHEENTKRVTTDLSTNCLSQTI